VKDSVDIKPSYVTNTPLTIHPHAYHAHATPLSAVQFNPNSVQAQRKDIVRKRVAPPPPRKTVSKKKQTEMRHAKERELLELSLQLKLKCLEKNFMEHWDGISERFPKISKKSKGVSDYLEFEIQKEEFSKKWIEFAQEVKRTEKTFTELQKRLVDDQEKIIEGLFMNQQQELRSMSVHVAPPKCKIRIDKDWVCPSWFSDEFQMLEKILVINNEEKDSSATE